MRCLSKSKRLPIILIDKYNRCNKMRNDSEEEQSELLTPLLSVNRSHDLESPIFKRLRVIKNKKITTANELIKARLSRQENKQLNHSSLKMPMRLTLRQQLTVNPQITSSNFFIQVFSPQLKTPPSSKLEIRKRQVSISSNKSVSSRYSRDKSLSNSSSYYSHQMKKIKISLSQQKLQSRLSSFSKESGKHSLRVYKQDIHKIIINRFGKDRITSFLDTQYIEDFNSVLKTMKQLVSLQKQQILVFTFLIVDQNKDGLITPDDLISLIGAKKEGASYFNQLVMKDLVRIIQYVERRKKQGELILDNITNPILKDQGLTFMKYKINKLRQKKMGEIGQIKRSKFITCRLKDHLYSLRQQHPNEENTQFEEKLSRLPIQDIFMNFFKAQEKKNQEVLFGQKQKFSINFERYSQIFNKEVPKIYIDFLYTLGGLQVPGYNYLPIDTSVLNINNQTKLIVQEQNKMEKVRKRLQQMNSFKRQLKILRIKTE